MTTFKEITYLGPRMVTGELELQDEQIEWRIQTKTGVKRVRVPLENVTMAQWCRPGARFELKLVLQGDAEKTAQIWRRFVGFKEEMKEQVRQYFDEKQVQFVDMGERATAGRHWGSVAVEDSSVTFETTIGEDTMTTFEIPFGDIKQTSAQGKNLWALEMNEHTRVRPEEVSLAEVRFFIPLEEHESTNGEEGQLQQLQNELLDKAKLRVDSKDAIARFSNVRSVAPNKTCSIELHKEFLVMHSKTGANTMTSRVAYDTLKRLFRFPNPRRHGGYYLVASLSKPLRIGQTSYPFLAFLLTEEEETISLNISDEELQEKYAKKLEKHMKDTQERLLARCLCQLSNTKVLQAAKDFFAADGVSKAIVCARKGNEGVLYPLNKSLFFLHKPPTLIAHSTVSVVELELRHMEKALILTISTSNQGDIILRNIHMDELPNLFSYLHKSKITIANEDKIAQHIARMQSGGVGRRGAMLAALAKTSADVEAVGVAAVSDGESSSDEDFAASAEEESDRDSDEDWAGIGEGDEEIAELVDEAELAAEYDEYDEEALLARRREELARERGEQADDEDEEDEDAGQPASKKARRSGASAGDMIDDDEIARLDAELPDE